MQSPLILNAEFQTAKNRLLKHFELSDHGGFSQQRRPGSRRTALYHLNPGRAIRCMKEKKLLRTEFYRTHSAGSKTESVNPDTPRVRRRSFLRVLRALRIILRPTLSSTLAAELERSRTRDGGIKIEADQ
jgi:hypothetical protein